MESNRALTKWSAPGFYTVLFWGGAKELSLCLQGRKFKKKTIIENFFKNYQGKRTVPLPSVRTRPHK